MKLFGGQSNTLNTFRKLSVRLTVVLALFLMPLVTTPVKASTQQDLNNLNQQIQDANNKLNNTRSERKTLQGEVAGFDRQIGDIQAQINATDAKLAKLNREITTTQNSIVKAEKDLATARDNLSEYLSVIYEEGQLSTLELIAVSKNFSDFVDRSEYLQTVQSRIKEMADEVIKQRTALETQKKSLEAKKTETETIRTQQAAQRQEIGIQRSDKNYLLSITKGDEAEFQALVAKLRKQYDQMQAEIWSRNNGNVVSLGHVNAGDIIGYIGNTGFSSGPHLHFEIRTSGYSHVNPANYIGNGYFVHPVPGVYVSQPYGPSSWWAYSYHTGIDYADGGRGTPIRATADGEIIFNGGIYYNTYPNGPLAYGHYVKIRHTNGMYSLYGHMR